MVIFIKISEDIRNYILNIDSEIRNLLVNKTLCLSNLILNKEFCVLKILCYCNKDIQHGFMSDSRLETFEHPRMCRYFWGMFQRTASYIKIRSGTAFSH